MPYPPDCIERLLHEIEMNDPREDPAVPHAQENNENRDRYRPHPTADQLGQLLDVAHAASLQPEEGRCSRFSLAFVSPEGLGRAHRAFPFSRPMELHARRIAKLAPAADPSATSIGAWPESQSGRLHIWGLIQTIDGPHFGEPSNENRTFLRKHAFLVVRVASAGVFLVYHFCRLLLVYARGETHWGIRPGRLQAVLRDQAGLDPQCAEQLCQVAARMVLMGVGGTLLVTDPVADVAQGALDLSYPFDRPNRLLADAVIEMTKQDFAQSTMPSLRAALDHVAQLSAIDGVVHMTSDLAVRGFGGKVAIQEVPCAKFLAEDPSPTRDANPEAVRPLSLSEIPGMRHRSAALFCAQQAGQALAIVVSQDGDVTLFGRQPDGVVRRLGPFALGVGLAVS